MQNNLLLIPSGLKSAISLKAQMKHCAKRAVSLRNIQAAVGTVLIITAVVGVVPTPSLSLSAGGRVAPNCPIEPKAGRIIVDFPKDWVVKSRSASFWQEGPLAVNVPAGTYDITLVSYDDHSKKADQRQLNESYFLKFLDASSQEFAKTNAISDLPEDKDILIEKVNAHLVISKDIKSIIARHALPLPDKDSNSVNSIVPVCVAFDRINTFSISGVKFEDKNKNGVNDDEPLLNGWTIKIAGPSGFSASQQTANGGKYQFSGLMTGSYSVCEVMQNGWEQTHPGAIPVVNGCHNVSLTNSDVTNKNFGNFKKPVEPAKFKIEGAVFNDKNKNKGWDTNEEGLKDWTVKIEGQNVNASTVTISAGNYEFSGLLKGTYKVCEVLKSGWEQTFPENNACHTVTITNSNVSHINFGNFQIPTEKPKFTIQGSKFEDKNKNGVWGSGEGTLPGWIIKIEGPNEFKNSKTTTSQGSYEFTGLEAGTYKICETMQSGWMQTHPANNACHTLNLTGNLSGVNFGNFQTPADEPTVILQIQKSVAKSLLLRGEVVKYTVVVKNVGNSDALNVVLTDTLPKGLSYSVQTAPDPLSTTWNLGTIKTNESKTITYDVKVDSDAQNGAYVNIAKAVASNHGQVSDDAKVNVEVVENPLLTIKKSANVTFTTPGSTVNYTVVVKNEGKVKLMNVTIKDTLPAGFTEIITGGSVLTWDIGDMNPGSTWEKTFSVKVGATVGIGTYKNIVIAQADNHSPVTDNADVEIRKGDVGGFEELPETGGLNDRNSMSLIMVALLLVIGTALLFNPLGALKQVISYRLV